MAALRPSCSARTCFGLHSDHSSCLDEYWEAQPSRLRTHKRQAQALAVTSRITDGVAAIQCVSILSHFDSKGLTLSPFGHRMGNYSCGARLRIGQPAQGYSGNSVRSRNWSGLPRGRNVCTALWANPEHSMLLGKFPRSSVKLRTSSHTRVQKARCTPFQGHDGPHMRYCT